MQLYRPWKEGMEDIRRHFGGKTYIIIITSPNDSPLIANEGNKFPAYFKTLHQIGIF